MPREATPVKSEKVILSDTTLRDAEPSCGVSLRWRDKLEIASALDQLGVDVIEAGFPQRSPSELHAVRAVAAEVRDAEVCALARAEPLDIACAWEAIRRARRPRIHVFIASSEIHRVGRGEAVERAVRQVVTLASAHTPNVELSLTDATRADSALLARLARAALEAGATTLNIPDSAGQARPDQVAQLIRRLFVAIPELAARTVSFHGRDDLGMATANAIAAVGAGARQVEVAQEGIAERAGNTSFEELVLALRVHGPELGVRSDFDSRDIRALDRLVAERSRSEFSPSKLAPGASAFRREAWPGPGV